MMLAFGPTEPEQVSAVLVFLAAAGAATSGAVLARRGDRAPPVRRDHDRGHGAGRGRDGAAVARLGRRVRRHREQALVRRCHHRRGHRHVLTPGHGPRPAQDPTAGRHDHRQPVDGGGVVVPRRTPPVGTHRRPDRRTGQRGGRRRRADGAARHRRADRATPDATRTSGRSGAGSHRVRRTRGRHRPAPDGPCPPQVRRRRVHRRPGVRARLHRAVRGGVADDPRWAGAAVQHLPRPHRQGVAGEPDPVRGGGQRRDAARRSTARPLRPDRDRTADADHLGGARPPVPDPLGQPGAVERAARDRRRARTTGDPRRTHRAAQPLRARRTDRRRSCRCSASAARCARSCSSTWTA